MKGKWVQKNTEEGVVFEMEQGSFRFRIDREDVDGCETSETCRALHAFEYSKTLEEHRPVDTIHICGPQPVKKAKQIVDVVFQMVEVRRIITNYELRIWTNIAQAIHDEEE